MLLKVFVGDKAISIFIEPSEDMIHLVFSIKNAVLNVNHDFAKTASFRLIFGTTQNGSINLIEALVDEFGRWVGSRTLTTQVANNLFLIICKDEIGNLIQISCTLCVIYE